MASCRQIGEQIKRARAAVSAQFSEVIAGHEHLLHLALNEAEALAWQTPYPQLVFADLAEEKAQSVAAWHDRQQSILQHNFPSAVAA